MKTIKIILTVISILVFIFFSTGLLIKETNYEASVSINAPLSNVFTKFNETGSIKKWIPEIKSVDTLKLNHGRIGSEFKIVLDNNGQEITMTEKVLSYIPNEKVTLFFDAENMLKTDNYIFSEVNGNTIVTLKSSCRSDSYILGCIYPYCKSIFQEQDQTYLNNFKVYAEQQ